MVRARIALKTCVIRSTTARNDSPSPCMPSVELDCFLLRFWKQSFRHQCQDSVTTSFGSLLCKASSKDQPILDPALLLPPHLSQSSSNLSSNSAASVQPSTASDDATSQRQRLPAGAGQGPDSSILGPGPMVANSSIVSDLSPAGALQNLPQEAATKPKRRLKRSRSSPILAGQQLEHPQHDIGENELNLQCCLPCSGRQVGLQGAVVQPALQVQHKDPRCFAIVSCLC